MQYALAVGRGQSLVLPARRHRYLPVPIVAALFIAWVVTSTIYVALSAHNTPPFIQATGDGRQATEEGPLPITYRLFYRLLPVLSSVACSVACHLSPVACSQGATQERTRELHGHDAMARLIRMEALVVSRIGIQQIVTAVERLVHLRQPAPGELRHHGPRHRHRLLEGVETLRERVPAASLRLAHVVPRRDVLRCADRHLGLPAIGRRHRQGVLQEAQHT